MGARVLLAGAGAREHAIAWKLRQSAKVDEIFVAPGNAGTALVGTNVAVQPKDIDGLVRAAAELRIDFYLATMDDPQPLGLVDRLRAKGIPCYGPTAAAAEIEASKAWSKAFMQRHGIATPSGRAFSDYEEAKRHLDSLGPGPVVVKASGLAAGKGAIVCDDRLEAHEALRQIMVDRAFGASGELALIEERIYGREVSAHAFCDGTTGVLMPFATDYKRALDGDRGLNTGGMGAYSPSAGVDDALRERIEREVVAATLAGMRNEGRPFNGTLFPGLMITNGQVRVIEYNARFGDPETQVLVPRLESDLLDVCQAAAEGRLAEIDVRWTARAAAGVVMASGGYPGEYETGKPINGAGDVDDGVLVFYAGARREGDAIVTSGGRVLTVVAMGGSVAEARAKAYENVARISFEGAHWRTDIAAGI